VSDTFSGFFPAFYIKKRKKVPLRKKMSFFPLKNRKRLFTYSRFCGIIMGGKNLLLNGGYLKHGN